MSESYGIQSVIKPSVAEAPVVIDTELVFIGNSATDNHRFEPVLCESLEDFTEKYEALNIGCSLADAANYAFAYMNLDHAWFINIGEEGDADPDIELADAKAGIDALDDIYNNHGAVPNLVVLPANNMHKLPSEIVSYAKQKCSKLNDHFKAQVVYDNTVNKNNVAKNTRNGVETGTYKFDTSLLPSKETFEGGVISCIGEIILNREEYRTVPMSIVVSCNRARQDAMNPGGVPCRSVGNLVCNGAVGYAVTFKDTSSYVNAEIDESKAIDDAMAENGFIIARNKGQRKYYTWGDHTAAVSEGSVDDELYRFDSNVAMAYHLANRWILKWGHVIDNPMTLSLRNDIINEEQNYLNYLVAVGALIGNPRCEFKSNDNTGDTLGKGQFYFTDTYTSAIPAKYLQLNLVWTSEGLASYLEG